MTELFEKLKFELSNKYYRSRRNLILASSFAIFCLLADVSRNEIRPGFSAVAVIGREFMIPVFLIVIISYFWFCPAL